MFEDDSSEDEDKGTDVGSESDDSDEEVTFSNNGKNSEQKPANDWSELSARAGLLYNDKKTSRLNWTKTVYSDTG